jgi:hypothetical protein
MRRKTWRPMARRASRSAGGVGLGTSHERAQEPVVTQPRGLRAGIIAG